MRARTTLVPASAALCSVLLIVIACRSGGESASAFVLAAEDDDCGQCHVDELVTLRTSRRHRGTGAGSPCLQCHAPHGTTEAGEMAPSEGGTRCEQCHTDVAADFVLPFRHPLDAELGCTGCHPPHGLSPLRERDHLRSESCLECHRELAGPFLFGHEGSRLRLCLSCHEAHGSPNRRLLTHADSRALCTSCHVNLEDVHIQNPGSVFQDCLLCHTEVHGSNWSRELFR